MLRNTITIMKTQVERNKEYLNRLKSNGYVRRQFVAPIEVIQKLNELYELEMQNYKKLLNNRNTVTVCNNVTANKGEAMTIPFGVHKHIQSLLNKLKTYQISDESNGIIAKRFLEYIQNAPEWNDTPRIFKH